MTETEFGKYHNKICQFTFEDNTMSHGFIIRQDITGKSEYYFVSDDNKTKYHEAVTAKDKSKQLTYSSLIDISTIMLATYIKNTMLDGNDMRFGILNILDAENKNDLTTKEIMNGKRLKQLLKCSDLELSANIRLLTKLKLTSMRPIGDGAILDDSEHFITMNGAKLKAEFEKNNKAFHEYIKADENLAEQGGNNSSGFVGNGVINKLLTSWQKMNYEFFNTVQTSDL